MGRLTSDEAHHVRILACCGYSVADIAAAYGTHFSTIYDILNWASHDGSPRKPRSGRPMAWRDVQDVLRLLRAGVSTRKAAEMTGWSRTQVWRISSGAGYKDLRE